MNILILSCGTRNIIVRCFRSAIAGNGSIIAADCSGLAPALYEADKFYIVPRIDSVEYMDTVLDICKKEQINGVLSLIDPELSLLALNKDKFAAVGTTVIGSSYELCELSLNKYEMYKWLNLHNYHCAKSFTGIIEFYDAIDRGEISYPVFAKPIHGSASISVSKVYDRETIEFLFSKNKGLFIQEFLDGTEIGADVYIDLISKEVVSIFTKKKLAMRSGETDKSVSFKDEELFGIIKRFVKDCGFLGAIDIDIFDVNGKYFISEVNPRFGGGYPHAYECGCDFMGFILNNINGIPNETQIGNYKSDVFMMKYNDVFIREAACDL